jgi:hypothetical protein
MVCSQWLSASKHRPAEEALLPHVLPGAWGIQTRAVEHERRIQRHGSERAYRYAVYVAVGANCRNGYACDKMSPRFAVLHSIYRAIPTLSASGGRQEMSLFHLNTAPEIVAHLVRAGAGLLLTSDF